MTRNRRAEARQPKPDANQVASDHTQSVGQRAAPESAEAARRALTEARILDRLNELDFAELRDVDRWLWARPEFRRRRLDLYRETLWAARDAILRGLIAGDAEALADAVLAAAALLRKAELDLTRVQLEDDAA